MRKANEGIVYMTSKQTDYLWNAVHQRDTSNAFLKGIAKKAERLARREKARVAMEKVISENLRLQLERAKADAAVREVEARDKAQVKEIIVPKAEKGSNTRALPDTVQEVLNHDKVGSDCSTLPGVMRWGIHE